MHWFKVSILISALVLSCSGLLHAETGSYRHRSVIELQRDTTLELALKYEASPDTAITPARVLKWIHTLMGHTPSDTTSNFEFQPIVRAHENQEQFIAQFAFKF